MLPQCSRPVDECVVLAVHVLPGHCNFHAGQQATFHDLITHTSIGPCTMDTKCCPARSPLGVVIRVTYGQIWAQHGMERHYSLCIMGFPCIVKEPLIPRGW